MCVCSPVQRQKRSSSLAYDCRPLNRASATGKARDLRDLLGESDAAISPQAAVFTPESTIRIARAMVGERTPYRITVAAAQAAAGAELLDRVAERYGHRRTRASQGL
jgi:hypothetical protein